MALILYFHPLASFCHKVLIALYETGTPFEPKMVDLADNASRADLLAHWPVGKIPVLHDEAAARTVAETSIIIEYLQHAHPGAVTVLPDAFEPQLETRLWDRFFDLYVSVPMQKIVIDRIRPAEAKDAYGVAEARAVLDLAYDMIEARMAGRQWAGADGFSMADCAAAPALFFAAIVHPFGDNRPALSAYFELLMARPSIARTIREAQPYFTMFPYRDAMPERFAPPG